jgi:predicted nucleic acid-binding protein
VLTLDSSALYALLNRRDQGHAVVREVLGHHRGPYIVPTGILAEVAYLVETGLGTVVMDGFLADVEAGAFTLDCGERDIPRIRALADRYANLPLGFADAAVVACAERSGGAVLTLDRRDFGVVAREGTITVLPG